MPERARVIAASEGNPLFLEEMAALAREQRQRGRSRDDPGAARGAPRAARAAERDLLERGAVEGEVFHRLAVCALTRGAQPRRSSRGSAASCVRR